MTVSQADRSPRPWTAPFERVLSTRIALNGEVALYVAVLAAAFALRFWDLGGRALHHDESIHAQWSWSLIQGSYRHSPIFHGPLYYHLQGLVFLLFGATDYTSRVSAAMFEGHQKNQKPQEIPEVEVDARFTVSGNAAKAARAQFKGAIAAGTLPSRNSSASTKPVSAQTATTG